MKKTIIILVVLAIAVGAFFFFRTGEKQKVNYETTLVKRGNLNNTVTATGTIEPITKVEVGTQVSGTISKIYVDYNSIVKKGQLLAELDRKLLEAALNSEMANMKSNKSEFEYQELLFGTEEEDNNASADFTPKNSSVTQSSKKPRINTKLRNRLTTKPSRIS